VELVGENEFLVLYIPATEKALVFRVKSVINRGFEWLDYGPLPLDSGETLPTYDGASATVPADGVLPGRAYTNTGKSFELSGAYDETDMWYVPEDYRERVFHVIEYVTPGWIRCDVQIPKEVSQGRFQRDKVITGVEKDFGFSRGVLEVVHIPRIHYGYRWGNDTNMNVYTFVKFQYGEYVVETPKSPELIFDLLTKKVRCRWITMPITIYDATIRTALLETYGFEGFPVYGVHQRREALSEYSRLVGEVMV